MTVFVFTCLVFQDMVTSIIGVYNVITRSLLRNVPLRMPG